MRNASMRNASMRNVPCAYKTESFGKICTNLYFSLLLRKFHRHYLVLASYYDLIERQVSNSPSHQLFQAIYIDPYMYVHIHLIT